MCLFLFFYYVSYFGRTSFTVFTVFIICIIATHVIQVKYYLVSHFSNTVMERSVLFSLPFKLYWNFFQLSFSSLWSFQIEIWKTQTTWYLVQPHQTYLCQICSFLCWSALSNINVFFLKVAAFFYFTLPAFMGLGPVGRTIRPSKGTTWYTSELMINRVYYT